MEKNFKNGLIEGFKDIKESFKLTSITTYDVGIVSSIIIFMISFILISILLLGLISIFI